MILYHSPEQQRIAQDTIGRLERDGVWRGIVTEIVPLEAFYPAEEYHRNFYSRNPSQPYCQGVIAPKVAKLRQKFLEKLKRR